MKIIEGFRLRNVCGEWVVMGEGVKQMNFNKLISLNNSAAMLWQNVEGRNFDVGNLVEILTVNYDIDHATAAKDAAEIAAEWRKTGLIDD